MTFGTLQNIMKLTRILIGLTCATLWSCEKVSEAATDAVDAAKDAAGDLIDGAKDLAGDAADAVTGGDDA